MNYEDTIAYLYWQLPMFQRIGPAAFKKDLTNTLRLCEALDNPQQKFRSIHIAGTNGKGSVAHMLAAVFQSAGYKTGLYTSPHLKDFRERIRVNGKMIKKQDCVNFVSKLRQNIDEIAPSFFEITVAMAFDHFAREAVDIAIVETGLGGRLDSTNILTPELSVITNIGFDHEQFLGNTLEAIAGEKAGIIKPGVPLVIGKSQPATRPVFEAIAGKNKVRPVFADQVCRADVRQQRGIPGTLSLDVHKSGDVWLKELLIDLAGQYQVANAITALVALDQLKNFRLSEDAIRRGLENVRALTGLRGRWDILSKHPLVIADCAHNPAGLEPVLEQLAAIEAGQLHMVWGMVNDKKAEPILGMLPPQAIYYFAKPEIPRGLDAADLQATAQKSGLNGTAYGSVREALRQARMQADEKDVIYVGGSSFVVAEVI